MTMSKSDVDALLKKAEGGFFRKASVAAQYRLGEAYFNGEGVERDPKKACEWFLKAADKGIAQYYLGVAYFSGEGVEQDKKKACEWFQKAADKGISAAQNALGCAYYNGEGVEQDKKKAFELCLKAGNKDKGSASGEAAYGLAIAYYNGEGVEQDKKKAFEWVQKAADKNIGAAQNALGCTYYQGEGVEQDKKKACEWLQKAADNGYTAAQCNLGTAYYIGEGVEQDKKKAFEWFQKAADKGYAAAQIALSRVYYNGEGGIEQDKKKACEWLQKAADNGYTAAQFNLGTAYYNGEGVEQDKKKACEWYHKAADKGYATAQYYLGEAYYNGEGVEQDKKKACEWFQKAADKGYAAAQNALGDAYFNGEGVEQNTKKACEWFLKAADNGYAAAQNALGGAYYNGEGVEQDKKIAYKWYEKAAQQGEMKAQYVLGIMYDRGDDVSKDEKLAKEWYQKAAAQGLSLAQEQITLIEISDKNSKNEIERLLKTLGTRLDVQRIRDGNTSLHIAISLGNKELVEALLYAEADFNILNKAGNSPLLLAKMHDDLYILALCEMAKIKKLVQEKIKFSNKVSKTKELTLEIKESKEIKESHEIVIDSLLNIYIEKTLGILEKIKGKEKEHIIHQLELIIGKSIGSLASIPYTPFLIKHQTSVREDGKSILLQNKKLRLQDEKTIKEFLLVTKKADENSESYIKRCKDLYNLALKAIGDFLDLNVQQQAYFELTNKALNCTLFLSGTQAIEFLSSIAVKEHPFWCDMQCLLVRLYEQQATNIKNLEQAVFWYKKIAIFYPIWAIERIKNIEKTIKTRKEKERKLLEHDQNIAKNVRGFIQLCHPKIKAQYLVYFQNKYQAVKQLVPSYALADSIFLQCADKHCKLV